MNTSRTLLSFSLTALASLLLVTGCQQPELKIDYHSGPDQSRLGARKVFPGQRVTDSLDSRTGDNTDWKEISIQEPGTMAVTVALDDTRKVKGFVALKDSFGIEMDRRPINASDNLYTFDRVPVYQGAYYVQVFADSGNSVYTTGVTFEPLVRKVQPTPRALPTAPAEDPKPKVKRRRKRRLDPCARCFKTTSTPATNSKPTTTPSTPTNSEDKVADLTEEAGWNLLRGRVIRVTPREEGGALLSISGFGRGDGVAAGMTGVISKVGQRFTVTQASNSAITAITKASPEKIKGFKAVAIKVKEK